MKNIFVILIGLLIFSSSASAERYNRAELEVLDKDTLIEIILDNQQSNKRHKKRVRAICDNNNNLKTLRGKTLATYSWQHLCQTGLEQLKTYNAICDNNNG